MSEISTSDGGKGDKKVRAKKMSTKIDMTPMVDLGFLLITFFILTTTLSKPVVMELGMPDKDDIKPETQPIKESEAITVLLDKDNKIYWYQGADPKTAEVIRTDYSPKGIRRTLLQKKAEVGEKFVVLISATDESSYKNMVDILDEMAITDNRRYAIVDFAPAYKAAIKKGETAAK
ncbi:MAG: biopolymer transporter ExbD [Cytophagaceae bacterium]|nr:biopolymer transporter ExbD [Cytophagaceae bacterium]